MMTEPIDIAEGERLAREAAKNTNKWWKSRWFERRGVQPYDADHIAHHDPEYIQRLHGLVRDAVTLVEELALHDCESYDCEDAWAENHRCVPVEARALLERVKL